MYLQSILGIGFLVGGVFNIVAYGYLLFVVTFNTPEHLPKRACKYCFLDPCVWRLLENYRKRPYKHLFDLKRLTHFNILIQCFANFIY